MRIKTKNKTIKKDDSRHIVARRELAKILGYGDEHINRLTADYGLPKAIRNGYDLIEIIRWLKKRHKEEIDDMSKDKPQDLLARKSAELKDLQIQEKKGELLDKFEVSAAWINQLQIIKGTIQGLAVKLSTKLPCEPKLTIEIAEKEIAVLLNKISNTKLEIEELEEE